MIPEEPTERELLLYNFYVVQDSLLYIGRVTAGKNLMYHEYIYAEGLVQKASLQLLVIHNIVQGGQWASMIDNHKLNYLVDPLSVASQIRSAYECLLTLHHVYVNPLSQDEIELRYLLWALSTYISKDQAEPGSTEDGKLARQQIREKIKDTVDYILTLPIVGLLDDQSQKIIKDKASPKTGSGWEYYIEGNKLKKVDNGWHGLAKRIPAREGAFKNLYKLLSINTHSTWHSVDVIVSGFQTTENEPDNFGMMDTMINLSALVGVFILYDYCHLFKEVREEFEQLPPHMKSIINFLLKSYKGDKFGL